ncbi:MAG TPA: hypothetical protein VHL30_02710 [Chlamydiales bacterium]|jgi:hypothetical protein|nr:hypothetical protein [Chlamydiales bacterium]
MIKGTFALFREPFDKANINRDHALDLYSPLAAATARVEYLAQIVASVVSLPFLILFGLFDLLTGNGHVLDIPTAIFGQVFIIIPLSIVSAILPLSWSRSIDKSFAEYTANRAATQSLNDCLLYLEALQQAKPHSIEKEDIQKAIGMKNAQLEKALKKSLEEIKEELAKAPVGSPQYADLCVILERKEKALEEEAQGSSEEILQALAAAEPGTLDYKNYSEVLARKIAEGPETIPNLRARLNAALSPVEKTAIAAAIVKKYVAAYTLQGLRLLLPTPSPEEQEAIEAAIREKENTIELLTNSKKIEFLANHSRLDLFAQALRKKEIRLNALAIRPLQELLDRLANSRNPIEQNDLSEAILRNYCHNHCYDSLSKQAKAPKNEFIRKALQRKEANLRTISNRPLNDLEAKLQHTAPVAPAKATVEHQDLREVVRRRYVLVKTTAELEALLIPGEAAPHPSIQAAARDAIERKKVIVRDLVNNRSLEQLVLAHARELNEIQKENLAKARDLKEAEINRILSTFTFQELEAQLQNMPPNSRRQTNFYTAWERKRDWLAAIAQNTTEQLAEEIRNLPEQQVVMKSDLNFLIACKSEQKAGEEAESA